MSITRKCSKCQIVKPVSSFYTKGKTGFLHSYCKDCFHKVQMERWINRKHQAINERGGKCSICGYKKNYASLVFHHTDPSKKDYSWNKLRLFSWSKINKELDKCIILCSNCHNETHYPQMAI